MDFSSSAAAVFHYMHKRTPERKEHLWIPWASKMLLVGLLVGYSLKQTTYIHTLIPGVLFPLLEQATPYFLDNESSWETDFVT